MPKDIEPKPKKKDEGYKHLAIKENTHKRLSQYGTLSDTYDKTLSRLLDEAEKFKNDNTIKTIKDYLDTNIKHIENKAGRDVDNVTFVRLDTLRDVRKFIEAMK